MSDSRDDKLVRPLGLSLGMHIALAVILTVGWYWHTEQQTLSPPAMMKASLVYAPKSAFKPQQKTQTQKQEKPKPEDVEKPEPPKPEVEKPKEQPKPEVKPTDKPSPIAAKEPAKPEQAKPEPVKQEQKKAQPKTEAKKQPDKKPEQPKKDAKQSDKKQQALSQVQKEKLSKDAEMAIEALLNDEQITAMGELTADEAGKWGALFANAIAEKWSRPPNARRGMITTLEIELLPNGQLVNVRIVESSGDIASDLAAESAVRKVDPETFKEIINKIIKDMGSAVFDKNFRKFNLKFNPEDLLM